MGFRTGLALCLLLAACSRFEGPGPFPLVGKFNDYNETFSGEVRINFETELYYLTLRAKNSRLYCDGLSRVVRNPIQRFNCAGNQAIAILRCTDGREITADWTGKTCNSAEGTGVDSTGAKISFAFGGTAAEAQQYLAAAEKEGAGKPSLSEGLAAQRPRGGSGTGFLISADGLVVTNHHVIDGANSIEVYQGDKIYPALVIARDAANDLAILKSEVRGQPLSLASARNSKRGDDVLTLGFPLAGYAGESQKATFGRINATAGFDDDVRYLQIDVPIQPGNSGGPLLNKQGEVIGVVSSSLGDVAAFRRSGAIPQNVNYAVKADYIMILVPASAQLAAAHSQQEQDFTTLAATAQNSVFRIVSKP